MAEKEITIDDVITFIIKNCDDTELMDKINKTSFPFTTKYLNSNRWGGKRSETITTVPSPYSPYTYCSTNDEALSPNKD